MVMYKALFFTISKKILIVLLISFSLFISSCGKEEPSIATCDIQGLIECDAASNAIKITLKNISEPDLEYVAYSDIYGMFEIQEVREGKYSVDANKDNYSLSRIVLDGHVFPRNGIIDINGTTTKDMVLFMTKPFSDYYDFKLDITTLSGEPIKNTIKIPRFTSSTALRLYNGTDESQSWSIDTDNCFVFASGEYFFEYIFSSFNPSSGTLQPGQTVEVIGLFNQDIYNYTPYFPDYPGTLMAYSTLIIYNGLASKDVKFDIDFQ